MGSRIDIDALYRRHQAELLRWFTRRTADAEVALDLWSETFAQAVRSQTRFRGIGDDAEAAWLYAIAGNQLTMYLRRGYAQQRAVTKLGPQRPPVTDQLLRDIERDAGLPELRDRLAVALATLGDETRQAVELRVVHERSYPEIAAELGLSEVAVRARVSRGLQSLADLLDPSILQEVTP